MTIKIDTDFAIPVSVAILAIILTIAHQTLVPKSSIDELLDENAVLFSEVSNANHEISTLTHQLEEYHTTEEALISLGASHTQAVAVIKAAEVYSLDPKLLGSLIASESSFHSRHHAIPTVVGLCGINLSCGSNLIYDPYIDEGNIMVAAKLLRDYKNLYGTDLKAIARYKGYSALGFQQAHLVMGIYNSIKD